MIGSFNLLAYFNLGHSALFLAIKIRLLGIMLLNLTILPEYRFFPCYAVGTLLVSFR